MIDETEPTLVSPDGVDLGRRRYRRAAATSATALLARGVNLASFLLIVPLTVHYLGTERYGVWMTVLSIVGFLSLTNLGMGNALITLIARTDAADNEQDAGRYVSTALLLFGSISLVLGVIAIATYPFIPWGAVFNVSAGSLSTDAARAAIAVIGVYVIGIPFSLVAQIRLGYQEGYINAWWDAAGSVFTLAAVAIAVAAGASLPVLVAAASAAPLIGSAANFALLVRKRPALRPRLRRAERRHAKTLLRSGSLFFFLQLALVIGFSTDNFVAAQVLGPSAVTQYAVPRRLAFAGITLLTVFLAPLWPAYAEALARHDRGWVLRTLRRSMIVATVTAIAGATVFLFAGRDIIRVWSRGEVVPSRGLLLGFAIWIVLASAGAALAMFLNAAHIVGIQVVFSSLMAIANITLSIVLARKIGVAGIIWGSVISYFVFVVCPYAILIPRVLRKIGLTYSDKDRVEPENA
ncbi:MAG: MATE family efflux transporter [Gaiellaceae bacterium]